MKPCNFRLRFHLADGYRIGSSEHPDGAIVRLNAGQRDQPIEASSRASLIGGPFPTDAEAMSAAIRAKTALLCWAAREQVGLDLGGGPPRSVVTKYGLEMLQSQLGVPIRNDVHGIAIYEDEPGVRFASASAEAIVGKSLDAFRDQFSRVFQLGAALTPKQEVAFELFCASFFDVSNRSRILTSVSAVEALLAPAVRSTHAQEVVTRMQELARSADLDDDDRQAMLSSLEWLRSESIGQAARALIATCLGTREYGGKLADRFFTLCYQIRSEILHRGAPANRSIDLGTTHNELRRLVSDVLQTVVPGAAV